MLQKKFIIKTLILFSLFIAFSSLTVNAKELRLNIGFWPGELDPELEPRFFKDDLIEGGDLGGINLPWANKSTFTIYPLGIQYFAPAGGGRLVFGVNWIFYGPEYRFNRIYPFGAVSIVNLKDFMINDIEGEVGYQLKAGTNFFITPKIGGRWHRQSFTYDEITIGNVFGISVGDNQFKASAFGTYFGVDLQIYVQNNLSFVFEYLNTAFFPGFGGDMEFKTTKVTTGNNIAITNQSSSYEVGIERFKIGLQFDIDKSKHIQFGIRQETQTHSYPGYINLGFIIAGGNANVGLDTFKEIVTDIIFWQTKEQQTKGLLYFAFSYDIPM